MYSPEEAKRIYATMNDEQQSLFRTMAVESYRETRSFLFENMEAVQKTLDDWAQVFPDPNERQYAHVGFLVAFGMSHEEAAAMTKEQALETIETYKRTTCTNKQKNVLRKYGYPEMPFDQASELIKRIAENGWQAPSDHTPVA